MYTTPSPDLLLEGVIIALGNDLMPAVTNPKAQATVAMAQAVLQMVRQTLAHYQEYLVDEHNAMTKVLREVAEAIGPATGPEAERIRARAAGVGAKPDFPTPVDPAIVMDAHHAANLGIVDSMRELDVLQRVGNADADRALQIIRAHMGPRLVRDVETMVVGAGMVGRG